jgi:HicB-like protein involved in pilus formation
MLISEYVAKVQKGLLALGEIGGPETSALTERLATALEPTVQATFLEALNELVQEYNLRFHEALGVTLGSDDVQIAPLAGAGAGTADSAEAPLQPGDLTARFALRLSDDLKSRFEKAAAASGQSANTWIVRALDRSLRDTEPGGAGPWRHEMRGHGRS